MVYRVITEATAQEDARDYAAYIIAKSKAIEPARKWLLELEQCIEALAEMPHRHARITEQAHFSIELRQFIHYSHRVVYHVNDEVGTVHVLRVYHGHRDELASDVSPSDILGQF